MIPLLIAGAVIGLGAYSSASSDNEAAREKNEEAKRIIDEATQIANASKAKCQRSIDDLAKEKTIVLQGNMKRFLKAFKKIKPVNFSEVGNVFERDKFDKNELITIQNMVSSVQNSHVNEIVGAASGTVLAVGAVDALAGGGILSGVGGLGSLSIAGASGAAALGVIAAPVFAIAGFFSASEASANLEKAKSNVAKAYAYQDEVETYKKVANAVGKRCDLFYKNLKTLNDDWFTEAVSHLEELVNSKNSFSDKINNIQKKPIFSRAEMESISSIAALAKLVKTIIATNILDENGKVTQESSNVINEIKGRLSCDEPLYKRYEGEVKIEDDCGQVMSEPIAPVKTDLANRKVVKQGVERRIENKKARLSQKPQGILAAFGRFLLWLTCIAWVLFGLMCIIAGEVIVGFIIIAAGLVMCPKIAKPMKVWVRIVLSIILLIIAMFIMV